MSNAGLQRRRRMEMEMQGLGRWKGVERWELLEHRVLVGLEYTQNLRREQERYCRRNETQRYGQAWEGTTSALLGDSNSWHW